MSPATSDPEETGTSECFLEQHAVLHEVDPEDGRS